MHSERAVAHEPMHESPPSSSQEDGVVVPASGEHLIAEMLEPETRPSPLPNVPGETAGAVAEAEKLNEALRTHKQYGEWKFDLASMEASGDIIGFEKSLAELRETSEMLAAAEGENERVQETVGSAKDTFVARLRACMAYSDEKGLDSGEDKVRYFMSGKMPDALSGAFADALHEWVLAARKASADGFKVDRPRRDIMAGAGYKNPDEFENLPHSPINAQIQELRAKTDGLRKYLNEVVERYESSKKTDQ